MKPLVSASYAQFGVDAGDVEFWATRNGIRITTHYPWRPGLVIILLLRLWIEPALWRKLCAV